MSIASIEKQIDRYGDLWAETQTAYDAGRISIATKNRLQKGYHEKAEELRKSLGYSGGDDGSKVIVTDVKKYTGYDNSGGDNVYSDGYEDIIKEKVERLEETGTMGIVETGGKPLNSSVVLLGIGAVVLLLILGK